MADFPDNIAGIGPNETAYPEALCVYLGERAPERIFGLGNLEILQQKMLAVFCSREYPPVLRKPALDLMEQLRERGTVVISGFHAELEQECLAVLLKGRQPLVWCMARRLPYKRLTQEQRGAMAQGRLLIFSIFGNKVKRAAAQTARTRNEGAAALAEKILTLHAVPGGNTENLCRRIIGWPKPLFALDHPDNAHLLGMGAHNHQDLLEK